MTKTYVQVFDEKFVKVRQHPVIAAAQNPLLTCQVDLTYEVLREMFELLDAAQGRFDALTDSSEAVLVAALQVFPRVLIERSLSYQTLRPRRYEETLRVALMCSSALAAVDTAVQLAGPLNQTSEHLRDWIERERRAGRCRPE